MCGSFTGFLLMTSMQREKNHCHINRSAYQSPVSIRHKAFKRRIDQAKSSCKLSKQQQCSKHHFKWFFKLFCGNSYAWIRNGICFHQSFFVASRNHATCRHRTTSTSTSNYKRYKTWLYFVASERASQDKVRWQPTQCNKHLQNKRNNERKSKQSKQRGSK